MKYPAYQNYQDTPEKWIGKLPRHWRTERIKFCFSEKKSIKNATLPAGAISYGRAVIKDGEKINPETRDTYQEVLSGEFIVNPINLNYDLISLRTALSKVNICVSPAYIVLKENSSKIFKSYGEFFLYVFDVSHMKSLGAGVRQTINFNDIGQCIFPLPSMEEQKAISSFLERETARIDTLIAKKTRFIGLLKEKRQAVITKAVTKGLDDSVTMKDSGVEWLGSVPAHWTVTAIKRIVSTPITDGPHETPVFHDEGVPFVSAEAISSGYINFEKIRGFISREDHERFSKKYLPKKGDIYMIKSGATTGVTAIVEDSREFNIWSPLAAIRCNHETHPLYVLSFMRSKNFLDAVALNWSYGTQQNIGMGVLENLSIALPPLNEQIKIADELNRKTTRLDDLALKTERSIELLKEHRAALITAAVTGKIDVREAA